jgi:hypothetical protein
MKSSAGDALNPEPVSSSMDLRFFFFFGWGGGGGKGGRGGLKRGGVKGSNSERE